MKKSGHYVEYLLWFHTDCSCISKAYIYHQVIQVSWLCKIWEWGGRIISCVAVPTKRFESARLQVN